MTFAGVKAVRAADDRHDQPAAQDGAYYQGPELPYGAIGAGVQANNSVFAKAAMTRETKRHVPERVTRQPPPRMFLSLIRGKRAPARQNRGCCPGLFGTGPARLCVSICFFIVCAMQLP